MLAAYTWGASWQLSRDVWATLDLSEVTKPIQGFGISLRIGSDQAILSHRQTGGPNIYMQSIFSGLFSLSFCLLREFWWMFHIHQPRHSLCMFPSVKVPPWLRIFPDPALWLHLSFAPHPSTLPKHGQNSWAVLAWQSWATGTQCRGAPSV